jgi:hypothetical protein
MRKMDTFAGLFRYDPDDQLLHQPSDYRPCSVLFRVCVHLTHRTFGGRPNVSLPPCPLRSARPARRDFTRNHDDLPHLTLRTLEPPGPPRVHSSRGGVMNDSERLSILLSWCTDVGIHIDSRLVLATDFRGSISVRNDSGSFIDPSTTRGFFCPWMSISPGLTCVHFSPRLLMSYLYLHHSHAALRLGLFNLDIVDPSHSGHHPKASRTLNTLMHTLKRDSVCPIWSQRTARSLACFIQ